MYLYKEELHSQRSYSYKLKFFMKKNFAEHILKFFAILLKLYLLSFFLFFKFYLLSFLGNPQQCLYCLLNKPC